MATRTEIEQRLTLGLDALLANVADLPEVAEEWDELADGERASWGLDWGHLMMDYLPELYLACRRGMMTPEQQRRYRELLAKLQQALPLLDRLDLTRPTVPLNEATATGPLF